MKEKDLAEEIYLFEGKVRKACEKAAIVTQKPYERHAYGGIIIRHQKNKCYEEVVRLNGLIHPQYIEDIKFLFIPLVSKFVYLWRRLQGREGSFYLLRSWTDALMKYFACSFYKIIDLLGTEYNYDEPALSPAERVVLKSQLKRAVDHWPKKYKEGIDPDIYDRDF